MAAVFDGRVHFLGWAERPVYRLLGTGPDKEQTWKRYAGSLIVFSAVSIGFTYLIIRLQGQPAPQPAAPGRPGTAAVSFNTAASLRHQHELAELRRRDDDVVLLPDRRADRPAVRQPGGRHRRGDRAGPRLRPARTRRRSATSGSTSPAACSTSCFRSPSSPGSSSSAQGAVQTLAGPAHIHNALNGVTQTIARGPIGFMEAIKQLGTNGGGFLDANSATPFENPTGAHQLALDLPAARHPVRPHLHLRQDGGERSATARRCWRPW